MGRIGRQRRCKGIDPLCKRRIDENDVDRKFNLEPQNEGNDAVPRKVQQIMRLSKVGLRAGVSKKKKKAKSKLLQKPGESTRKFFDRLDTQVGEALNKALMETKQLRVKRKDHLKKRDQKQKRKKMKNFEQFENNNPGLEQTDHVKFGEVVSQPPTLSAVPRKGQARKASLDLKLLKLVGKKTEGSIDRTYKLKRKEMTDKMKKIHDLEREKAIKEYRKMKQRKAIRT